MTIKGNFGFDTFLTLSAGILTNDISDLNVILFLKLTINHCLKNLLQRILCIIQKYCNICTSQTYFFSYLFLFIKMQFTVCFRSLHFTFQSNYIMFNRACVDISVNIILVKYYYNNI